MYSNDTIVNSNKKENKLLTLLKNKKSRKYIILAVVFAAIGAYFVLRSFAATNSCTVLNGATVCDVNMWVTGNITAGEDTYLDTGNANVTSTFYGAVFRAPIKEAPGTVPVYRVNNKSLTFHDWVTEPQKRTKESVVSGLVNEGVQFYAWDRPDAQPGTVPVYRLGCGGAGSGIESTRYTTDLATANAYKVTQSNGFSCTTTDGQNPNFLPFIAFYAYPPAQKITPYVVFGSGTGTANSYDPGRLRNAVSVTASRYSNTCSLISGGTVQCWGNNRYGQLGDGTTNGRSTPTLVPNLTGVTSVSSSANHTCAVISGGTVKCWGYNGYGQIGYGKFGYREYPAYVTSTVL